jgi:1-acyl-sn-glycerol-3-phosphate acyltransferase
LARSKKFIGARSLAFNVLSYATLLVYGVLGLPTFLLPSRFALGCIRIYALTNLWLLRVICGTTVEWRGLDNIPQGPCIIACKHQSAWETFALYAVIHDPTYILKRELMWLPLFGWYAWKTGLIPVDRSAGRAALSNMTRIAQRELKRGRQIVIFPEGTRRPPGAEPDYKPGALFLYSRANVPCVPMALNSGLYWPRRRFLRFPCKIRVEVLDPIQPGQDRNAFFTALEQGLEAATARLVAEGLRDLGGAGRSHSEAAQSRA